MRPIDADVLLEQMKHRKEYVGRPSDPVCLVEDAPTIGGWISVKDRLPDKTKKYEKLVLASLIDNDTGHRWECPVIAEYSTKHDKWIIDGGFENVTVTHWMPRPEPPRGIL